MSNKKPLSRLIFMSPRLENGKRATNGFIAGRVWEMCGGCPSPNKKANLAYEIGQLNHTMQGRQAYDRLARTHPDAISSLKHVLEHEVGLLPEDFLPLLNAARDWPRNKDNKLTTRYEYKAWPERWVVGLFVPKGVQPGRTICGPLSEQDANAQAVVLESVSKALALGYRWVRTSSCGMAIFEKDNGPQ